MKSRHSAFDYFIIFGAAVRADGTPSGTLSRRVEAALISVRDVPRRKFIVSGGVGRYGPAEADVIADMLRSAGVLPDEIIRDDKSRDTVETVIACTKILNARHDARSITICTSRYHQARCRVLFSLMSYPSKPGAVLGDRSALGTAKWLYYWGRDFIAIPVDAALICWLRFSGATRR